MDTADRQALRTRRDAVVNAHIEAEAVRHDVAAALATFRNPRYEVPAVGLIADGADAVEGLLNQLLAAFPDFWLTKDAVHHGDDVVVVEARFGGTHRGVWAGMAATNKPMEVQSALIFVFDDADLICEKVYFDHATVLRQLGAPA
ncbi:SnoaL-like polyketide cyclase [Caballeronia terrestris]|uniref:SnoaL-like polyketide cyclase n=1 Tax=Caballeronia terrestris TaxID=1226301 RepID=A0A158GRU4_9BURK|nr:ester cyclase [Caballeronia terrestris]SAL34826.1 SnoaL-like polyketide cyclase [Caballeronia terrestris]